MPFMIVAKEAREDATYYERPEQAAARKRLADMNGLTFDTLEEAEEYLDIRGCKCEESWAYPSEHAAPGAAKIWFLRLKNPAFRIGAAFQLCVVRKTLPKYTGTHPANISKGLLEIAERVGGKDAEALKTYAGDVERLMKAAGVKHF